MKDELKITEEQKRIAWKNLFNFVSVDRKVEEELKQKHEREKNNEKI